MKYRNTLWQRIEALEKRLPRPRQPDVEAQRYHDAFVGLLERMDDRYRTQVLADIERSPRGFDHLSTNLTMAVARYVRRHLQRGTPLELPAEVAAVFEQNPQARASQECEECGYDLPPEFVQCPLCGGKVGMGQYAYYKKHGYSKPADAHRRTNRL